MAEKANVAANPKPKKLRITGNIKFNSPPAPEHSGASVSKKDV